jgi:DNA-binding response OmpR family regulator
MRQQTCSRCSHLSKTRALADRQLVSSKPPLRVVPAGNNGTTRKWLRILIADDDRDTANMLAMVLRDEGHEVQVTLRGDDALEICRLFRPDVLVADINMPGTSGYAMARELRERHGELAPLLIAISGVWTQTTDRVLGKAVGFDHYLLKPCDAKEVIRLIEPLRSGRSGEEAASG